MGKTRKEKMRNRKKKKKKKSMCVRKAKKYNKLL